MNEEEHRKEHLKGIRKTCLCNSCLKARDEEISRVRETQLDKQKVEVVIVKLAKGRKFQLGENKLNQINFAVCKCLDDLKKELGLE